METLSAVGRLFSHAETCSFRDARLKQVLIFSCSLTCHTLGFYPASLPRSETVTLVGPKSPIVCVKGDQLRT